VLFILSAYKEKIKSRDKQLSLDPKQQQDMLGRSQHAAAIQRDQIIKKNHIFHHFF
jgi:hypothetical protein